ncbi:UNVERIFIED_CONTAM: hypothetical protein Sangu_1084200 [Sesamum angustifolium]|uniref:Uncharacterized protein n=1 Tax=Sesamum angustifolium TaxID=2727405 RepID=A0AAW2P0T3_9LAMI
MVQQGLWAAVWAVWAAVWAAVVLLGCGMGCCCVGWSLGPGMLGGPLEVDWARIRLDN